MELVGPGGREGVRRGVRRLAHLGSLWMLDAWEPEAYWSLHRRRTRPDGALLVGFPFSAVYWAASWLARERARYVVDLGDPWALTLPAGERPPMGRLRAAQCEEFVWRHAAAGVVTTELQAARLRERFAHLPLIVRPNGYRPVRAACQPQLPPPRRDRTLRLVHYGNLYESRIDIRPVIAGLAACGEWDSVVFTQQGEDWTRALHDLPPSVHVEVCPQVGWNEVVATAPEHDLAVVVGNRDPAQLPSKAVQYLTLPIPRLAIVGGEAADSLSAYVRDKPGWLTLPADAPAFTAGRAVAAHAGRTWSPGQLVPPEHESWEAVADSLVDVLLRHTVAAGRPPPASQPAERAIAAASSSQPR